jgi:hypothetical protein
MHVHVFRLVFTIGIELEDLKEKDSNCDDRAFNCKCLDFIAPR